MKIINTFLLTFLFAITVFAQAPQKMSYQAVVRNSSNNLLSNQTVGMEISILKGSSTGTTVYAETQTPSTNSNGLISLEIGSGTVISGTFTSINWENGPLFIQTKIDPNGGTNYSITSTSQFLSVPYALYAKNSGFISGNAGEIIYNNGTNWVTLAPGTAGQMLQSNGTSAPSWKSELVCYADRDGDGKGDKYSRFNTFSDSCPTNFVTDNSDCDDNNASNTAATPTANSATNRSANSFTANWTTVNNATKYYLDIATDSNFTSFVSGYNNKDVSNVTTLNITGLDACTNYYYRVRSVNSCGTSTNSNTAIVDTFQCKIFNYTGADQSFTVPANVTNLSVKLWGAQGGSDLDIGGYGGYVSGTLNVTPGAILNIISGGGGGSWDYGNSAGGYGGGGNSISSCGGGGGGRSAIQINGSDLVTAGGGGGALWTRGSNPGGAEGTGSGGAGGSTGDCWGSPGIGGTSYTTNPLFTVAVSQIGANGANVTEGVNGKVQLNWQ